MSQIECDKKRTVHFNRERACTFQIQICMLILGKLDWKANTIGTRPNGQNGIHEKLCRLATEKHRIGPKLVSEAIS